jgi:broad specificity phosphatase PhoE
MRLFVLARHGESVLNHEQRVNGDPSVDVPLTEQGRAEAAELGQSLSGLDLDLCVHSRFPRTAETARIAMGDRELECGVEQLFDDVDVGDLEGWKIEDYRTWKHSHERDEAFPGGESLNGAARRYAEAFRALLASSQSRVLVVTHEIPIRYALNGLAGSPTLDGPAHEIPNAVPYLFDQEGLTRAAEGIDAVAGKVSP